MTGRPPVPALPLADRLAHFDQLFADSAYLAFLLDADGRVLAVNPHGRKLLGPAATPGAAAAGLYAPWAAAVLLEQALPLSRANGCWRGELDMLDAHGCPLAMSQMLEWRPAAQGVGSGCYLCLSFDLSDYDTFQSLLRFKRLFDHHPHPMWVYDLASLRFMVVNLAAIRLYGYTEAEFLAMTIKDIRPPQDLERLHANLAAAPRRGSEQAGYWTHCRKDGSRIQVEVSSHSVTIAGQAARFVLCHDVTAQAETEAALYASRELMQLIINQMPHQIFWKDLAARYLGCNTVFAQAAGLACNEDVVGKSDDEFHWSHNAMRIRADDSEIIRTDHALLNQEEYLDRPDGSRQWFLINKAPLHDRAGRIIGVLGTIEDISERKRAELAMLLQARALDASVNAIAIVASTAGGDQIEYVNPAFVQLTGYTAEEVQHHSLQLLLDGGDDPADRAVLQTALQSRHDATVLLRHYDKQGQPFWAKLHVAPVHAHDDGVNHHVCVLTDMTETIRYQQQLEHQASHDALTDLPNRHLLADRLEQAIGYAQRYQHAVWVAFIDLDNFKLVNDSLGHQQGDQLLRTVADRLRACVRDSDTVARLGGDEFTLLLMETPHSPAAASLLRRVLEAVTAPVTLGEHRHTVTCSIGVSIWPQDGGDPQQLLRQADIAMYRAKESGRNQVQFYEAAMHTRVTERTVIEAELRHALERGELSLHYQPKASLRSGAIQGMEALLRWQHPTLGMVSPARFIGVAEETGLIVPIGRWVVRTACAQNQAWQRAGLAPQRIAVNLSSRQFNDPGLVDDIIAALVDSGLKPQYLELELTESLMMDNVGAAVEVLARLKKIGVALSIDDFGTGYSSLAYLRLFPVDYLKIDQSFVRDMLSDPKVAAIVRSIIGLAHSLDFKAVAEGVETAAQLAYLRRYQCDEMQGYFFSRPLPAADMAELLRQERSLPADSRGAAGRQTLLLLDDEPNILAALTRLLRRDGYTILCANTAQEAFALLAIHEVHVVVSDQRMPGMNGTEFLSRVKKLYPGTVRIILSGYTEFESVLGAINRGEIYRFYTKPWTDEAMRESIREAFQYHQLIHGQPCEG